MVQCLGMMAGAGLSCGAGVGAARLQAAGCYLALSDSQVSQGPWLCVLGVAPALDASIGLSVGLVW